MKLKMSKKAVGITLLVIATVLFSVSGVFAYATAEIIQNGGGHYTTPDGDTFFWDNFTIPTSKSIGPVGSILISGTSGVLGVFCIVHGRRKFTT